jgi:hypothetical protein
MTSPIILNKPLDEYQQAVVDMLTDALEEAMKGRISTCGMVACMDDGVAPIMAGRNAGGLLLGILQLQENIRVEVFEKGNIAKKRSHIVRAR